MIKLILESLIPSDQEFEMPSAAEINFDSYAVQYGIEAMVNKYIMLVDTLAHKKLKRPFADVDGDTRLTILNDSRSEDIRLFSAFLTHVFCAYYTNAVVLERVGSGSVPPFPRGNPSEQDDWNILENVYERGRIFRHVDASTS
jgi:hypothetical protein